jgi:predicted dehydrogenase
VSGVAGVAVAGTGFGCFTHVRALRNAGFDVVALVGRDPEKTAARADAFDVPRAMTSWADTLALHGVDAVTIATPPHTHAELTEAALRSGKHVLCEKPFAHDVDEARRVRDAAEASGLVHLLGTEFRFDTGQALLARTVASGAIGSPRLAFFLLHVPVLVGDVDVPLWWAGAESGGGWLGAHGLQVIDQVRCTLGEFESVSAALAHVAGRPASEMSADDGFAVHFRMRSGAVGVMQSTAADWGPIMMTTRIAGSQGTVWVEGDTVWLADRTGSRQVPVPDDLRVGPPDPPPPDLLVTAYDLLHSTGIDVGPYTRLAETFRDLVLGRPVAADPRPATFADGVADMAVLDAVRRSAAAGAWVPVA